MRSGSLPARRTSPTACGVSGACAGTLDVLMLDAERTFDRLIVERAPDRADAILGNRVYRTIAGSFAGAQEYLAIERLHQLADTGDYDLIVVDTPPSRHAVDILAAPERLDAFLGHPVYRTLTIPGRSMARVTNTAATAFSWTVRRLAGPQIVEDTIEFFRLLSGLEDGLRARAKAVSAMLREPTTAFRVWCRAHGRKRSTRRCICVTRSSPSGTHSARRSPTWCIPCPPDCDLDEATVPAGLGVGRPAGLPPRAHGPRPGRTASSWPSCGRPPIAQTEPTTDRSGSRSRCSTTTSTASTPSPSSPTYWQAERPDVPPCLTPPVRRPPAGTGGRPEQTDAHPVVQDSGHARRPASVTTVPS